jgi:FHA domain-containing protein
MGLQQFERRLERLVEGAFSRAFKSGLQPVEIGRRVVREADAGRALGVRGTVLPNQYAVRIATEDADRFAEFEGALSAELAQAIREHARDEGAHFLGPVRVEIQRDERVHLGEMRVDATIVEGAGDWASLTLPGGARVPLGEDRVLIGRMADCRISLSDSQVSRRHAEVRRGERGYLIVDLGSTNGTKVNGTVVKERWLTDGDEIVVGDTRLVFEGA